MDLGHTLSSVVGVGIGSTQVEGTGLVGQRLGWVWSDKASPAVVLRVQEGRLRSATGPDPSTYTERTHYRSLRLVYLLLRFSDTGPF